jgi:putative IMPACT (imprinted ancient) family translation regulator
MYKIPAKLYRTEETIKRSRFIATVAHAFTEEDAKFSFLLLKMNFQMQHIIAGHMLQVLLGIPPE